MAVSRFGPSARYSCLIMLLALLCPAARGQDSSSKRPAPALVQVNITTETPGAPETVAVNGKVINYRPTLLEFFPTTGIVIDDKAHVLAFLGYRWVDIQGRNPRIEVIDPAGKKHTGELVGIDQSVRVAVVLCKGSALKKTPLCERCEFKDGANVILPVADGIKFSQFENAQLQSVSAGGDSSGGGGWAIKISRPVSLIGAPLLNSQGQVIGLVADEPSREVSPEPRINVTILTVSQMLRSANKIIKANGDIQTGWLGVWVDSTAKSESGVTISGVEKDSPADKAGLLPGDVMVKWNGQTIRTPDKYIEIVENTPIGSKAFIEVLRQGNPVTLTAVIEARKPQGPSERLAFDFPSLMALPGAQITAGDTQLQSSFGVETVPLTPQLADILQVPFQIGLLVTSVNPRTAFDRAGVLAGDVILGVDGLKLGNSQLFNEHIKSRGSGSRLVLRLLRKGVLLEKYVQLPSRKHKP